MKKNLLFIFVCIIPLFFITACADNVNNTMDENNNNNNNNSTDESLKDQTDYTELGIFGAKLKFKLANPTYLWDCDDNFGAGEIDTVFIPSKNGEEVEGYDDVENISGIIFQTSEDIISSESKIKNNYKKWHNLDVVVENLEHDLYGRHIKGENSKIYIETYAFKYDGNFEGKIVKDNYYRIHLEIHKDDYTQEEITKVIEEFHLIIDTLEIVI